MGERRPIENSQTIKGMLENSNLLITAWDGKELIGLSRSVTDFHYCCYLSDLAVSEDYQNKGIGKNLIMETFRNLKDGCKIILLSAPLAKDYYPRIGFKLHDSAWVINNIEELK